MFRLLTSVWHYSAALLNNLFNERADPRIQIEQAIDEARQVHLRLVDQAAAVIGGQRELEMKLARGTSELRRLDGSTVKALRLAQGARQKGDEKAAASYERSAEIFATQLATTEDSIIDLRELYERASLMAGAARRAVEQNRFELERQLAERARLLNDLNAAEMQERMADALKNLDRFAPDNSIPSLPRLRDRIEERIGKGAAEVEIRIDNVESRLAEIGRAVEVSRGTELLEAIREREGLTSGEGGRE